MENKLFHRYYDVLFGDKDYRSEAKMTFDLFSQSLSSPPSRMLELGCGTGNHTLEFCRLVEKLTAIDLDQDMVKICLEKISHNNIENVNLICTAVEKLETEKVPAACALFNVITYIQNYGGLVSFFKSTFELMESPGIFLFDCWNGLATIKDPPQEKKFTASENGYRLSCHLTCKTNYFDQVADLNYRIQLMSNQGDLLESEDFSFPQRLWMPSQIFDALAIAGFEKVKCVRPFEFSEKATEADWKIMFVCEK